MLVDILEADALLLRRGMLLVRCFVGRELRELQER